MNEQRLQAYFQLIERLLSCPNGEENQILAANQELLDTEFVQVVTEIAERYEQEGKKNTAEWLKNLAAYLTPENQPVTQADIDKYLAFLLELLKATSNSNGDTSVIYPLLAANIDKIDCIFAKIMQFWATNTLAEAKPDTAIYIANHIGNFSNLIQDFPLGNKADKMEIAITGYEIILSVYTRSDFPKQWAMAQYNLGIAYSERISGERAQNIELAIVALSAALEVYTPSAFPERWATTQNNLGVVYSDRISGERAQNIEKAIAAYHAALEVRTRTAFPEEWALTQSNLGNAYRERIFGEKSENIESAIASYRAALEVFTPNAFPKKNAEVLSNLGILYQYETRQFDIAYDTFAQAIEILESLRGEINSGEETKRKQAEESNRLYRSMVEACLALNKHSEAIEYAERSKTRNLVELILNRDLKTIFPPGIATQLEELNNKIASGQYELQNSKAKNPLALAQDIQQWRQQRQLLQDSYLPVGSGFKFDQLQQTLDNNTAIIEWYIVSNAIITFIIKPNGQKLTYWQSQPEDLDVLLDWVNEYIEDYYKPNDSDKIQWRNQLESRLQKLAQILNIEEIIAQLPKECERLILIPSHFLHLFPLHTLPIQESYLMDLFPQGVGYAPSLQILQQVQLRQRPNFQSLFAVKNPTTDLYQDYDQDLGAVSAIKKQWFLRT